MWGHTEGQKGVSVRELAALTDTETFYVLCRYTSWNILTDGLIMAGWF